MTWCKHTHRYTNKQPPNESKRICAAWGNIILCNGRARVRSRGFSISKVSSRVAAQRRKLSAMPRTTSRQTRDIYMFLYVCARARDWQNICVCCKIYACAYAQHAVSDTIWTRNESDWVWWSLIVSPQPREDVFVCVCVWEKTHVEPTHRTHNASYTSYMWVYVQMHPHDARNDYDSESKNRIVSESLYRHYNIFYYSINIRRLAADWVYNYTNW